MSQEEETQPLLIQLLLALWTILQHIPLALGCRGGYCYGRMICESGPLEGVLYIHYSAWVSVAGESAVRMQVCRLSSCCCGRW